MFLRRNPYCVACNAQGVLAAATDVDRIMPHRGDRKLMWDEHNLQALCRACHSRKTAREDSGFGNAPRSS